jgi:hypothetical protein
MRLVAEMLKYAVDEPGVAQLGASATLAPHVNGLIARTVPLYRTFPFLVTVLLFRRKQSLILQSPATRKYV